jgi:hypothetical protein
MLDYNVWIYQKKLALSYNLLKGKSRNILTTALIETKIKLMIYFSKNKRSYNSENYIEYKIKRNVYL